MTAHFEKQITKAEIALTGVACVLMVSLFALVVIGKAF